MPRTSANAGQAPQTEQYPSTQLFAIEGVQWRLQACRKGTGKSATTAWKASESAPTKAAVSPIRSVSWHTDILNRVKISNSACSVGSKVAIFGVPLR